MGIKRIAIRGQRIRSFGYLKKNFTELLGFMKTRKRGARQVFGQLFYFYKAIEFTN
jgi:hypothetical protein